MYYHMKSEKEFFFNDKNMYGIKTEKKKQEQDWNGTLATKLNTTSI